MSDQPAISVSGLRKAFGDNTVLDGIDISVPAGSVFALLGPNGSGKTTTVKILSTLAQPDSGEIRIAGLDPASDRDAICARIGLTGQFAAVDTLLTGRENLTMVARLRHLPKHQAHERVEKLLTDFDLVDAADRRVAEYSGGMTRRLDLAMTLVGEPSIIFLDEPTTGLDPRSRRTVWETVRGLVARGTTIFLTTQYLEEADHLADRIAVLDRGRIVAEGTAAELKQLVPGGHIRIGFADADDRERARRAFSSSVDGQEENSLAVPSGGGIGAIRDVLSTLDAAGIEATGISVHTPDLDDVFLTITGRSAATL
ncbi:MULTISPECIES: ABC transporter ATP-binding protein [Gordonia]|uniref:ATP-binding cassette domain-containing protein n=1 Tax=Gordonia amicalis TaxID=89053 RepID=A0AAE4RAL3_9ACTN|nr:MULTISPECIES: ATP-binding cassette domain-containing protein [Gordonia]ATD69297.1 ABC transporter [Gordonia sp. 1D]KAF0971192.1 Daunorubicin/doxorubicin resistance ATP-binding protein DrrA [Gordonia sp. YY1]MCZ4581273.1 ATP-binding cassette domain-containing protein [Gordonia amicalis]MCZ4650214.1 ATP-binding cassette domain-containing protein [Gordonia amicalis]MDJ0451991.1 ATP-binding cassette domain-containing protein [Gordonia amicalis]